MNHNRKIAVVAMSGGVDSSVASLLLQKEGYEVIGLTAIMFDSENAKSAVAKAKSVCDRLGIRHEVADITKEFQQCVIDYFETSYKSGYTPNPCTVCNRTIKWGKLKEFAVKQLGADVYATGHYAQITCEDGIYKLSKPADQKKDQTYMLFALTQDDLAITRFPLGGLEKTEVKRIAAEHGFVSAQSKESQDVCFIQPPDSTKKYLSRILGDEKGNIVDINTGKVLGRHDGAYKFTIGQRKGIGVAASEPLYVVKTDVSKNIVYVGFKDKVFSKEFCAESVNWQQPKPTAPIRAMIKIRYNSPATSGEVVLLEDSKVKVVLDEPQSAITLGQSAVFYDLANKYVLGGGWIS